MTECDHEGFIGKIAVGGMDDRHCVTQCPRCGSVCYSFHGDDGLWHQKSPWMKLYEGVTIQSEDD